MVSTTTITKSKTSAEEVLVGSAGEVLPWSLPDSRVQHPHTYKLPSNAGGALCVEIERTAPALASICPLNNNPILRLKISNNNTWLMMRITSEEEELVGVVAEVEAAAVEATVLCVALNHNKIHSNSYNHLLFQIRCMPFISRRKIRDYPPKMHSWDSMLEFNPSRRYLITNSTSKMTCRSGTTRRNKRPIFKRLPKSSTLSTSK